MLLLQLFIAFSFGALCTLVYAAWQLRGEAGMAATLKLLVRLDGPKPGTPR